MALVSLRIPGSLAPSVRDDLQTLIEVELVGLKD